MLNELAALREAATTSKPVRPVANPGWVSARRGQHHVKATHAVRLLEICPRRHASLPPAHGGPPSWQANVIQHEWRRTKLFEELQSGTDHRRMRQRLRAAEANPVSSGPIGSGSALVAPRSFSPPTPRPELRDGSGVASPSRDAGSPPGSLRSTLRRRGRERERRAEEARRRRGEAAVLPRPERRLARQAGRSALLTQSDGSLFPLYTETRTFDRFGTDVSQYFHFMYHSKSFFMFLFVINLSNIIVNIEGMGQSFSWFTVHTLGNTASDGVLAKGGHSYAVIEFLTAGCMVAYLFFIRGGDADRPALTATLAQTAHPKPNPNRKPSPWRQPQALRPNPSPHPPPPSLSP